MIADCADTPAQPYNDPFAGCCADIDCRNGRLARCIRAMEDRYSANPCGVFVRFADPTIDLPPPLVPDVWFEHEIVVRGDDYAVFLTNTLPGERRQTTTLHNTDGDRGRAPGLIGVQVYPGSVVAWRHIRIRT